MHPADAFLTTANTFHFGQLALGRIRGRPRRPLYEKDGSWESRRKSRDPEKASRSLTLSPCKCNLENQSCPNGHQHHNALARCSRPRIPEGGQDERDSLSHGGLRVVVAWPLPLAAAPVTTRLVPPPTGLLFTPPRGLQRDLYGVYICTSRITVYTALSTFIHRLCESHSC